MNRFRLIAIAAIAGLALEGLAACTGETEINPQPLPPEEKTQEPPRNGEPTSAVDDGKGGSSGGGFGAPDATPDGTPDACDAGGGG